MKRKIKEANLRKNDILFGRGSNLNHHNKNTLWREYVDNEDFKRSYQLHPYKDRYAKHILQLVLAHSRPAARFLVRSEDDPQSWQEAEYEEILEKTKRKLREKCSRLLSVRMIHPNASGDDHEGEVQSPQLNHVTPSPGAGFVTINFVTATDNESPITELSNEGGSNVIAMDVVSQNDDAPSVEVTANTVAIDQQIVQLRTELGRLRQELHVSTTHFTEAIGSIMTLMTQIRSTLPPRSGDPN